MESFQFPAVWDDDSRINALFAPFRPKSLNPVDWEAKLKFWENLICQYCLQQENPIFSLENLKKAFARKGRTPACLDDVVVEMTRSGTLVHADKFRNYALTGESYTEWAARLLFKNPMLWALNKVSTPFVAKPDLNTIQYAHIPTVKKLSEDFIKRLPLKPNGRLMEIKDIMKITDVNEESLKIILRPLIEEKRAAVAILPSATLIKFAADHEKVTSISEIDHGVYELEKNEVVLKNNIDSLEEEREAAVKEAKICLSNNRRQMAKTWLRRKNELEKYIDKRASALENIRCLLDKIRQAESDSLILDAYKQGTSALKETFRTTGLTERKAEETMDEIEDVLDVHKDIEATLARSLDPEADSNLEDELAELLLDTAPDVPPAAPSTSGGSGIGTDTKLITIETNDSPTTLPHVPELDSLPSTVHLPDVPTIDDVLEARIKALAL